MKNLLRTALALALAGVMCLAVVATSVDSSVVVPSIEQKAAPTVVEESVTATDENGEEVEIDAGDIIVTPIQREGHSFR